MAVATAQESKRRAVSRELLAHTARISLLTSDDFWAAHERGLAQIRSGITVEIEALRPKYGPPAS